MPNDEPMTVDRLIGILEGLRVATGGGAIVHVVVEDEDGVPIAYDIADHKVIDYPDINLKAVRFLACQF